MIVLIMLLLLCAQSVHAMEMEEEDDGLSLDTIVKGSSAGLIGYGTSLCLKSIAPTIAIPVGCATAIACAVAEEKCHQMLIEDDLVEKSLTTIEDWLKKKSQ